MSELNDAINSAKQAAILQLKNSGGASWFKEYHNIPGDWRNPNWNKEEKCHCWRNYINNEVIKIWDTFSDEQKQAIAQNAQEIADIEDWE